MSANSQVRLLVENIVAHRAGQQLSPTTQHENAARLKLGQFLGKHRDWGLRVYRTCAGLRVIVTHALFDPTADEAAAIFEAVGADPLYQRLCKSQRSFRARLTPKPWRCGHTANNIRWPRETADEQQRFDRWSSEYSARQVDYATCRLLEVLGSGVVHPAVEPIVELHDHMTRCQESLKLA